MPMDSVDAALLSVESSSKSATAAVDCFDPLLSESLLFLPLMAATFLGPAPVEEEAVVVVSVFAEEMVAVVVEEEVVVVVIASVFVLLLFVEATFEARPFFSFLVSSLFSCILLFLPKRGSFLVVLLGLLFASLVVDRFEEEEDDEDVELVAWEEGFPLGLGLLSC